MKRLLGLSLAAAIALTTQVCAKEVKLEVAGNAALTSNYVWRGISYTNTTPTAQVGVDFDNLGKVEGLHLNLWGSGIQEGSEIDTIIGYSFKAGAATIDVGAINYYYTQDYVDEAGNGTFAGASYAEAYVDVQFSNFGISVWSEIGYADSNTDSYDGLTVIANASFGGFEAYAGTRMTDYVDNGTPAEDSFFYQVSYSFDSILIPSFTTTLFVAGNDQFEDQQGDYTAGVTFSKDF